MLNKYKQTERYVNRCFTFQYIRRKLVGEKLREQAAHSWRKSQSYDTTLLDYSASNIRTW